MTKKQDDLKQKIMKHASEKKGEKIIALDLEGLSLIADYFVIISGRNDRQVKAIVEGIASELSKEGIKPHSIEGLGEGKWVLIDYGTVVAHVFCEETREYYQLESLWADAEKAEFIEEANN